jgi:hypothetical protein
MAEKIKLLSGKKENDAVFEKSGIKMEFTIAELDVFIDQLNEQKADVSNDILQLEMLIDKLKEPDLSSLNEKQMADFSVFCRYSNQVKLALSEMEKLVDANPTFHDVYDKIEEKEDAPKFISFNEELKTKVAESELLDKTIELYEKDRKKAISCLE